MKNLDKLKQPPKVATASKLILLLAVIFFSFIYFNAFAQKITINAIGYKLAEADTVALNRLVKQEANLYNGLFDNAIPDSLPVVINIYKNRKEFLQEWNDNKEIMLPGGYYKPTNQQCYVYKDGNYFSVILHEVSHRFMHYNNYSGVPKWINEGLSEFFEALYIADNKGIYVDEQTPRLKRVKDYLKDNRLNLKEFLSIDTQQAWNKKDDVTLRFDVAYSILFFIIKTHPEFIKQIFAALKQGKDSYTALGFVYGSYQLFETRFKQFYR
ncbi:DUF1570 domain-containing protein [Mucilaginibacter terrae]|uniref:DUF1570 domain-containing protein n=1 Tax=Mucilaginibacter terrae TaxID=1955052 RepID=UPI00363E21F1